MLEERLGLINLMFLIVCYFNFEFEFKIFNLILIDKLIESNRSF